MIEIEQLITFNGIFPLYRDNNHFIIKNTNDILLELDIEYLDHDTIQVFNIKRNKDLKESNDLDDLMYHYLIQDMRFKIISYGLTEDNALFWFNTLNFREPTVEVFDLNEKRIITKDGTDFSNNKQSEYRWKIANGKNNIDSLYVTLKNTQYYKKVIENSEQYRFIGVPYPYEGLLSYNLGYIYNPTDNLSLFDHRLFGNSKNRYQDVGRF
jgi:hypothetical protein